MVLAQDSRRGDERPITRARLLLAQDPLAAKQHDTGSRRTVKRNVSSAAA